MRAELITYWRIVSDLIRSLDDVTKSRSDEERKRYEYAAARCRREAETAFRRANGETEIASVRAVLMDCREAHLKVVRGELAPSMRGDPNWRESWHPAFERLHSVIAELPMEMSDLMSRLLNSEAHAQAADLKRAALRELTISDHYRDHYDEMFKCDNTLADLTLQELERHPYEFPHVSQLFAICHNEFGSVDTKSINRLLSRLAVKLRRRPDELVSMSVASFVAAWHGDDGGEVTEEPQASGWAFRVPPSEDSKYKHGPIQGNCKQFCLWIGKNARTLKKHNGAGEWYIQAVDGKNLKTWFDTHERFLEVDRQVLMDRKGTNRHKEA